MSTENETMRTFVQRVAEQKPEKPDYWSSCGQCEGNIEAAQDLLAADKCNGGVMESEKSGFEDEPPC